MQFSISEAFANKGYSPLLNFQVDDIIKTIQNIKDYGGSLDGDVITQENIKVFIIFNDIKKIKYFRFFYKIACFRAPDGEMIGLYEGNAYEESESGDYFLFFLIESVFYRKK